MSEVDLHLGVAACTVAAEPDVLAGMDPYLDHVPSAGPAVPHLRIELAADPAELVSLTASLPRRPHDARVRSHPDLAYLGWHTAQGRGLLPEHGPHHAITVHPGRVTVVAAEPAHLARVGVRIVRQALMRAAQARGGMLVHAGAVSLDGDGLLLGGRPGSGKTSIVTSLIEDCDARPVANDRAIVVPTDNHGWEIIGVPLAFRISPEGAAASPALAAALATHPLSRGNELVDGKMELTPREVGAFLARPLLLRAPLRRIALLHRNDEEHDASQPRNVTPELLKDVVAHPDDVLFTDDWLGLLPHLSTRCPPDGEEGLWRHLAHAVPTRVHTWTRPEQLRPTVAAEIARAAAGDGAR